MFNIIVITACFFLQPIMAIPSPATIFYPFGPDQGDTTAPVNDDGYIGPVTVNILFPFFNTSRQSVYVSTNGAISFDAGITTFTPSPFPFSTGISMIAVYWCDVDTRVNDGRVYYRESTDQTLLNRATSDVLQAYASQGLYNFQARWIFIATWYNVTFYGGSYNTPTQSFQVVLITDGTNSFAMLNYGNIVWTTGTASDGDPITGLGGTPAQVGFDAGDGVNYYAVSWSRTADIVLIGNQSNIGTTGRWIFRINTATIEDTDCNGQGYTCLYYQTVTSTGTCEDIAPMFACPRLIGPQVINRLWIEFYCSILTNVTDTRARYEVTFLFNGQAYNDIPQQTVSGTNPTATLHERHLFGKLGKYISCNVSSYWTTSSLKSRVVSSNNYWAGIQADNYFLTIREQDTSPTTLILRSTLPITCLSTPSTINTLCNISLTVVATSDLAVRQQARTCSYLIAENDWDSSTSSAYNDNAVLQIRAKTDDYITAPRYNTLRFSFGIFPTKTANGVSYINMWTNYSLPTITVYKYDFYPSAQSTNYYCTSNGDPRIRTFDGLSYSSYASGQFIYGRSTSGIPVEVHVRHWPCTRAVSCVCGVALRENDAILAIDMCNGASEPMYTAYNAKNLPTGSGITVSDSANTNKIRMPSGNKVMVYRYTWGMNIYIYLNEYNRTEGLCGNFDEIPNNDWKLKASTVIASTADAFVESWRLPAGQSLFEGYLVDLSTGGDDSTSSTELSTYCSCPAETSNDDSQVPLCDGPAVAVDMTTAAQEPRNSVGLLNLDELLVASIRDAISMSTRTDYVDLQYNPSSFNYSSNPSVNFTWPTSNGITNEVAVSQCHSRILNVTLIGTTCYQLIDNTTLAADIIQMCVDDVQVTGDYLTWSIDKVPAVQRACIDIIVRQNRSEVDNTADVTALVSAALYDVSRYICDPVDCNQHGTCINATCVCTSGYIGTGCSILSSSTPVIVSVLDRSDCDIRTRLCQSVRLQTANLTTTSTTVASVRVTYYGQTTSTETFETSLVLTSSSRVQCRLPVNPLSLFTINIDSSSSSSVSSLSTGSPVIKYYISVTNDGQKFSNEVEFRVYDSTCFACATTDCIRQSDTCVINGYCFGQNDVSPFDYCLQCIPSYSIDSWFSLTDNGTCVPTTTTLTTTPSSSGIECGTAGYCRPEEICVTRSATQNICALPCDDTTWSELIDYNSLFGIWHPGVSTVDDCRQLCTLNSGCQAIDFDRRRSQHCWLHIDDNYQQTIGYYPGVNQYAIQRNCSNCFAARWKIYAIRNSLYGVRQSSIDGLAHCQRHCIADWRCAAIDWTPGQQSGHRCWTHSSDDLFESTRSHWPGTWQYVIVDRCITGRTSTSSTRRQTPTVATVSRTTPARQSGN